jgi:acetoin utilization protein AcuC
MSGSVVLVWSEELLNDDLGATHPMAPGRLEFTMALAHDLDVLAAGDLRITTPRPASTDVLQLVHDPAYVAAVRAAVPGDSALHAAFGLGGDDNPIFEGRHEASALVTGATMDAAIAVRTGEALHAVNLAGGLHRGPGSASTTTPLSPSPGCWPTACRGWPTSTWTPTTATAWKPRSTATPGC